MVPIFVISISFIILAQSINVRWKKFSPTKVYAYVDDCKNWNDASDFCNTTLGAQLASVHLLEQRTFIVNWMLNLDPSTGSCATPSPLTGHGYGIWLGGLHNGTNTSNERTTSVHWFDGTVTPFTDIEWDSGEPNYYEGGRQRGIGLHYPNFKFHTADLGDIGNAFVCQAIVETPSPTTTIPTTQNPSTNPTAYPIAVPTTLRSAEVEEETTTEEPDLFEKHDHVHDHQETLLHGIIWPLAGIGGALIVLFSIVWILCCCCRCRKKTHYAESKVEPTPLVPAHHMLPLTVHYSSSGQANVTQNISTETKGGNPNLMDDEFIVGSDTEDNHETMRQDERNEGDSARALSPVEYDIGEVEDTSQV
eukprot:1072903_1